MLKTSRLVLMLLLVPCLALAAPKKKKKPAPPPGPTAVDLQIRAALDGAEQQVGACVLEHAADGDFTLVVQARLSLNTAGQLLGSTITFVPEQEKAEAMRACIDAVLHTVTFPRSSGALVLAEREWKFSTAP